MKTNIQLIVAVLLMMVACSSKNDNSVIKQSNDTGIKKDLYVNELPLKKVIPEEIVIEKDLLYDQHTLEDEYAYQDTTRRFQWEKIKEGLALIENFQNEPSVWGILQNRRNVNGRPPVAKGAKKDPHYNEMDDPYGVEGTQSIPLYSKMDTVTPERYGRDGSLIRIIEDGDENITATLAYFEGEWQIPSRYIKTITPEDTLIFKKVIFVDRTNQNIASLEKVGDKWLVRSMNPATTGLHKPPYERETPLGIFVIQEKKERMSYLVDGTDRIGGFAPYASRFSNGGYLHGVPVNLPRTAFIEFSSTLGTTPRSHMCVRNATSHAKFLYDWAPVDRALVYVIE